MFIFKNKIFKSERGMNPLDNSNLTIESERIKLVSIREKYIPNIFKEFNDEITTYMYPIPAKNIAETTGLVKSIMKKNESGDDFTFIIIHKDTEEFIGMGGVHHLRKPFPEFGIWTTKHSHGNHYGFEAIQAAYYYFSKKYSGFIYPVDKDNIPSKKIPLRLGGILKKRIDQLNMGGKVLHIEEYFIPVD